MYDAKEYILWLLSFHHGIDNCAGDSVSLIGWGD